MDILAFLIAGFLAAAMGASGFAVSFAPSFGSGALRRGTAAALYGICVVAGSLVFAPRVVATLTNRLNAAPLPAESGVIVIAVALAAMVISNRLRVPQSTSWIVVASFAGAGAHFGTVRWETVERIFLAAVVGSVVSLAATYALQRAMYPPTHKNLRLYDFLYRRRTAFRRFVVGSDMYSAFSVGTNNVANVVAPLLSIAALSPSVLLLAFAPLFGVGAYLGGRPLLSSLGKDIVHLGEFSASIVSLVTATCVITASWMGLPAPYAAFSIFALIGVSCVKDGFRATREKNIVRRIAWVWITVPLATFAASRAAHAVLLEGAR